MEHKPIYLDGVDVSKCYRYQKKTGYCKGAFKPEELPFCENFDCEFKKLARKTQECEQKDERIIELTKEALSLKQECEELEDFRTLVREPFAFGDSDVDDESFIKYLNEYVTDMTEALDGYQKLTDILEIDWTIHGPYDIEEIIKQVIELKQERDELKEKLKTAENDAIKDHEERLARLEKMHFVQVEKEEEKANIQP